VTMKCTPEWTLCLLNPVKEKRVCNIPLKFQRS
jgi:hypothetical protein